MYIIFEVGSFTELVPMIYDKGSSFSDNVFPSVLELPYSNDTLNSF